MTAAPGKIRSVGGLSSAAELRDHARGLGLALAVDEDERASAATLAGAFRLPDGFTVGNRFCIQPMEGWDGTAEGQPGELTERRWRRFGGSGAKLIWGGEATAVSPDGRANPNQLVMSEANQPAIARLCEILVAEHQAAMGRTDDLLVGLQLTHSGRFARGADGSPRPLLAYPHPVLDQRLPAGSARLLSDAELDEIAAAYGRAARLTADAGFDFVDVKHCHGYLGHELLSATTRPGRYGGSFTNRTRFLRQIIEGIRVTCPALRIGVRLSVFDLPPFETGDDGVGRAARVALPYPHAFGANPDDPAVPQPDEVDRLIDELRGLGVQLINVTVGSPYYNPHIQRPALFPPSDGYAPPEDPLCGVERQLRLTARYKQRFPELVFVGSGYSYLQQWIPRVAAPLVRAGQVDSVGLGRLALSYPTLPRDVLAGSPLEKRLFCRTFSDCTTAPRNGLVSGCYPLDPFYRDRPEYGVLKSLRPRAAAKSPP